MLISLNNVTFEFGARAIIENANWTIFPKERIGLIGANGMGKSTILKLLAGEYTVTGGTIEKARETTIGYFHQDLQSIETDESIMVVASGAFTEAVAIQAELDEIVKELDVHSTDALLEKYSERLHDFEIAGGYEMEHKTAQILEGLGFATKDLQRPYSEFSGGWRMRVILAKMILQQPDLLMLDEPTNHLDLPSIEWLETFLLGYPGAVIIVSHDRFFLDKMVTKIVEVSMQQLNHYTGNFSFYEQEKEVRKEFQQREFENQQDYIRQQERFIERFKAKASKATQAQSAMKRLDKLDKVEAPNNSSQTIKIRFNIDKEPGKIVASLQGISKNYGDVSVLKNTNIDIERGDKIALIGANGKGKSTALRIIAGTDSYDGTSELGHNVSLSFYAQHQLEALNVKHEIIEELADGSVGYTEMELRGLLGCFLFTGDDVFKKINVLSGGEKARVALAKTIIKKCNFMLLDEPTNHLDIGSVNMLASALNDYKGTYLLVSHDRYFIEKAANKIWEIDNGIINEFVGTYVEWEEAKMKKLAEQQGKTTAPKLAKLQNANIVEKKAEVIEVKKNEPINKEEQKKLKNLQNTFKRVEENLNTAQAKKTELEDSLANPNLYQNKDKFVQIENDYSKIKNTISNLQLEYEDLFEQILILEK
jgi:ATP-binding cassette, subfamily F, member 3